MIFEFFMFFFIVFIFFIAAMTVMVKTRKHVTYAGDIVIEQRGEKKVISLELSLDPDEFEHSKQVYFKIKPQNKQPL